MLLIILGVSIGTLVFLLFHTDFILEYSKLLGFGGHFRRYETWRRSKENESYFLPIYLREEFQGFWPRLLGCPICLSIFLSLLSGPYFLATGFIALVSFKILEKLYK